jgi:hypothetical protein
VSDGLQVAVMVFSLSVMAFIPFLKVKHGLHMQPWRFAEKGGSNRQSKNEQDHLPFSEGPLLWKPKKQ